MDRQLIAISKRQLDDFDGYRAAADTCINKVFNVLRSQSKRCRKLFSKQISRVKVGGNIGKRTSLGHYTEPDFDVVIFFDDEGPPFHDLINHFQLILERHYCCSGIYIHQISTHYSLQFKFRVTEYHSEFRGMYFSFDLLPAANLLCDSELSLTQSKREVIQAERALHCIYNLENPEYFCNWNLFSSSMCELAISFVKYQSEFVHDVIRLAKSWDIKVRWDEPIPGRSMMIELIAISAAIEEEDDADEEQRPESISLAFQIFLSKFINFDRNMDVYFPFQTNKHQWRAYDIYREQTRCRPLILDPINPYNNLAENVPYGAKKAYKKRAWKTLNNFWHCTWRWALWRIERNFAY